MKRCLLITNATAGSNDEQSVDAACEVLQADGVAIEVVATKDTGELLDVLSDRHDRDVVVAGGDGSLHAVIAALETRGELHEPTIGLVPLGTGNDFARGVRLPLDPAAAAVVIVGGRQGEIDILVDADGGIVVNAVHVGVGAEAGHEAKPWKPRLGRLGYVVGGLIAGVKAKGHRIRVIADNEVLADGHRRVLQVGIANGAYVGGGTELVPGADPADGLADVLVSFSVAPMDRLLYAVRVKGGTHEERHDVHTARAAMVRVDGESFWCNADGELLEPVHRRTWSVRSQAFTMMLPTAEQEQESGS